ncbi:MAG: multicopper oxidase domain-containing protein [Hyphomicrobiales bacterium]
MACDPAPFDVVDVHPIASEGPWGEGRRPRGSRISGRFGAAAAALALLFALRPSLAAAGETGSSAEAALSAHAAVRALAVSGPVVAIQPLTLDFGIVTIGSTDSRDYTVQNTGDSDLHITDVVISDAQITTNETVPMTLAPGASFVATATYAPTGGLVVGTLEVQSDATNGAFHINVKGQANHAPVIDPIGPVAATAYIPVSFTVHATDLDGDPIHLSIDGLPTGAAFDTLTATFTWTPSGADAGDHPMTVSASDGFSTTTLDVIVTVTVLNHPPIADAGGPYSGLTGQPVTFDGSGSHDPDGNALTFHWTFGDDAEGTGERPTHVYLKAVDYPVTLDVTDDGTPNLSASAGTFVSIVNPTGSDQITIPAIADNSIFSESDSSYGGGQCIQVGRPNQNRGTTVLIRRGLVRFDLSSIPPGSQVVSARLNLFRLEQGGPGTRLRLYRLTQDWGEGTSGSGQSCTPPPKQFGNAPSESSSTWNYRFYGSGARWENESGAPSPGGAIASAFSDSELVSPFASYFGLESIGITNDVAAWVRDPTTNHGWALLGDEAVLGTGMRFASRQDSLPAHWPSLTISFSPQAGACCKPDGTCDQLTRAECDAASGIYGGDNSTCEQQVCLQPYVDWLPIPSVAVPVRGRAGGAAYYEIRMKEFRQKVHRDLPPTTLWGFDGQVPGPTIEAYRDQPVRVRWINDLRYYDTGLPRTDHYFDVDTSIHGPDVEGKTPRTVVHLHGGHVPPESDGFPESTFVFGGSRTDRYPNSQLPATLWYHDHALGITRYNIMLGLSGFYIIRDRFEDALPLPRGPYEIPLVVQDRSFNADGSLKYPAKWTPMFFGDKVMVNGKVWPKLLVDRGKYRFRVLNGSNHRIFTFTLSDHHPFWVIGSDGGLLSAPVQVDKIQLGPAERADIVLDFESYAPDSEVLFQDTLEAGQVDASDPTAPRIMKFVVSDKPGFTTPLPQILRPVERLQESQATRTRTFELRFDQNLQKFRLGDFGWDEMTEFPTLGSTEIWQFANETLEPHPMHIHLEEFQILDRSSFQLVDGKVVPGNDRRAPDPAEAGWKDTAEVNPGELVRILIRFGPDGFLGNYVFHCHMLEHEDNDMMRQFTVVPPKGRKPTVETARAKPDRLWPADLTMVPVEITGVTDSTGAPVAIHVTRVTQDEPISHRGRGMASAMTPRSTVHAMAMDQGDDGACSDAQIVDGKLYLRRERQDGGNGRAYRVSFAAVGPDGGVAEGTVLVGVPARAGVRRVVDDGQSYNSMEGCVGRGDQMDMAMKSPQSLGQTFTTDLGWPRFQGGHAILNYTLAQAGEVSLAIFDVQGRLVASTGEGVKDPGAHTASLDLHHLAHGIYFVRMHAGGKDYVKRMPVLRTGE